MGMRKVSISLALAAVALLIVGLSSMASGQSGVYTGTIYAAGMGGHMAVVDVTIDPSNTQNPITVNDLSRITIGNSPTSKPEDYTFHDVRIDLTRGKAGKLYWSGFNPDSDGLYRYGRVDLQSKRTDCDIQMAKPARSQKSPPGFCGSGQDTNYFLPVWMGYEGFIEVINKDTCVREDRVYLDATVPPVQTYYFAHGTSKDDFSTMSVSYNLMPSGSKKGKVVNLKMSDLVKGISTVTLNGPTITGLPGTIFFRQDWTPDGQYLLQAGRSQLFVLDSNLNKVCQINLPVVYGKQVENHDATTVKNSNYGVMQQRNYVMRNGVVMMDGMLQLFSISNCQLIGNPVSMCIGCHDKNNVLGNKQQQPGNALKLTASAVTCGIDSVWN